MPSTPVPVCCVRIPERILLSTPLPDVDGQLYVLACFEGRPCLPQLIELLQPGPFSSCYYHHVWDRFVVSTS